MFSDEELEKFRKAGKIAREARDFAKSTVKAGQTLLSIGDEIEKLIESKGGKPAFPVNLSLNEVAAHYVPSSSDETVLKEDDVLKADIGVHVEGFIADCAFSINPSGKHADLTKSSEKALESALRAMKAGVNVRGVGKAIQDAVVADGFKPVRNLCGHALGEFLIHAGQEIPNVPTGDYVLKEGDVFAVEPFASTGEGVVREGEFCQIYALANPSAQVRLPNSRKLLQFVVENFKTLPFAQRWLSRTGLPESSISLALSDLCRQKVLRRYPLLRDVPGSFVSQAETSVVVTKEGVERLV
ncbi:MAG: type II methionyl aminopeptidase [Candidatus Micrarchaeia archaeon]